MSSYPFFIGTHVSKEHPTIYLCEADFEKGMFTTLYELQEIDGPGYLAGPKESMLYSIGSIWDGSAGKGDITEGGAEGCAGEGCASEGGVTEGGGAVYAIDVNGSYNSTCTGISDRKERVVSALPSGGLNPCHIAVDPRGEFLLCANYGSGSVSLYDLNADGSIHSMCDHIQYSGVGFDHADRQKGPHAHFAAFHTERDEVLVCDLGLDTVHIYVLDRDEKKLRPAGRDIRLPDGSGPRHLIFGGSHPGMLYVLTEMANTVFAYRYDAALAQYVCVQAVPAVPAVPREDLMVPDSADNGSIGCAIRLTDDGKYLFTSSRLGYQCISAFSCGDDGLLHFCDSALCGGITPRDFAVISERATDQDTQMIGDARDFILVANQASDTVTALCYDRKTEKLSRLPMEMEVPGPTCILPV